MSEVETGKVWVSGELFNVDYLLDTSSGRPVRRVELASVGGTTAGVGRPCGGTFVAVYVSPARDCLILQVGTQRVVLDDHARARHRRRFGGVLSQLTVLREGQAPISVHQWNGAGALLRRVDPGYDDLDDSSDDFLADVAAIVATPERREWMLITKDPEAGPWERLRSG